MKVQAYQSISIAAVVAIPTILLLSVAWTYGGFIVIVSTCIIISPVILLIAISCFDVVSEALRDMRRGRSGPSAGPPDRHARGGRIAEQVPQGAAERHAGPRRSDPAGRLPERTGSCLDLPTSVHHDGASSERAAQAKAAGADCPELEGGSTLRIIKGGRAA